ncbi:MAG: hypothetical protein IPJ19_05330 [Planctomycetes bacterium]|nr:hypothetical protein [Planctomycetota bacterium]
MAHDHGEAFPRAETNELVGEALRTEHRRGWIQDLLVALALALLALGLPLERLLGQPVRADERVHFLASAVCFALGWLVLARAARRSAWDSAPALRASLVAASAPVVLFAATTPGPAAAGWLGACLVLVVLVREETPPLVRGAAWLAAAALHPWNIWVWPAWLLRERRGRAVPIACGVLVGASLALRFPHHPSELFAGLDGGPGPCVAWWTLWIAGLGGAAAGLVALARGAPAWILAFALVPLAPLSLGGTIGYDLPWIWLAPLGWLGVLELEKRGRRTGLLLATSLACGAAALVWVRATDPERAWREAAQERLEPSDLVLTRSAAHRYLLATRHGLEVRMLPAEADEALRQAIDAARAAHRRVVLDAASLAGLDESSVRWARALADLSLGAR